MHGYYGSWQGRHQLWMGMEQSVAEGTAVTRDDLPPGEEESYVIGPTFYGTLAKRSYMEAALEDIQNIPVEIWIDQNYQLTFTDCVGNDGLKEWCSCDLIEWVEGQPQCAEGHASTFDLTSLLVGETDTKKSVWIDGFDNNAMENKQFVYLADGEIYEAAQEETMFGMRFVSTGEIIEEAGVPML